MPRTRSHVLALAAALAAAITLLPEPAAAQGRRIVRPAPRPGRVVIAATYYRPYYRPFYGYGFSDPWYPYPWGWYPPPPYAYGQFYDNTASLRVEVKPRDAEVFVDGYYAGRVDDFDGVFQRLRLEPGDHDVTIYMAGYHTATHKIFLQPGGSFSIKDDLQPLPPGAPAEPRPVVSSSPRPEPRPRDPQVRNRDANRRESGYRTGDTAPPLSSEYGAIAIRVQPGDAEVLIDGERWEGPADDEALLVQVAPGAHRIEVRKDGYRGYAAQLEVRAGQTAPINVALQPQ